MRRCCRLNIARTKPVCLRNPHMMVLRERVLSNLGSTFGSRNRCRPPTLQLNSRNLLERSGLPAEEDTLQTSNGLDVLDGAEHSGTYISVDGPSRSSLCVVTHFMMNDSSVDDRPGYQSRARVAFLRRVSSDYDVSESSTSTVISSALSSTDGRHHQPADPVEHRICHLRPIQFALSSSDIFRSQSPGVGPSRQVMAYSALMYVCAGGRIC